MSLCLTLLAINLNDWLNLCVFCTECQIDQWLPVIVGPQVMPLNNENDLNLSHSFDSFESDSANVLTGVDRLIEDTLDSEHSF